MDFTIRYLRPEDGEAVHEILLGRQAIISTKPDYVIGGGCYVEATMMRGVKAPDQAAQTQKTGSQKNGSMR